MKCYKLTNENNQTKNETLWGPGVTHRATGSGKSLCSNGWIHFYTDSLIAILMNPLHGNFRFPRMWEAESSGEELLEPLKAGSKELTTIKEIDVPHASLAQRIAFAILCTKKVSHNQAWNVWADNWLSGVDRSEKSATSATTSAAAAADAAYAAYAAANIDFVAIANQAMSYK